MTIQPLDRAAPDQAPPPQPPPPQAAPPQPASAQAMPPGVMPPGVTPAQAVSPQATPPQTIGQVLAAARARLSRVTPAQAHREAAGGAVLVDIRPAAQRAAEGEIPGALIIERNVLEWRLDPASGAQLPIASHDLQVIVFCSEGYTSSLAAAALQDLGIRRATDLDGGFCAWRAAGLPVRPSAG